MPEPLSQLNPDNSPEDDSPDLEGIEGGGESSPRETGHLRPLPSRMTDDSAEPGSDPSGLHAIAGGGETTPRSRGHLRDSSALSSGQMNAAERTAKPGKKGVLPGAEAGLVRGGLGAFGPQEKPPKGILGLASRMFQSKRARNGGIVGGGIVGLVIILITTFSPVLRLEHLFQNINNRAFAAAGDAVEWRMEHLFDRYILKKIINLNACKATVSTDCRADYKNSGIAKNLFNAWRDARVEDKIFAKMGLKVESTKNPDRKIGVHRLTLRDAGGNVKTFADESDWNSFKNGQFEGGRREFGSQMRKALRDNTFNLNIIQRKQVRKYLERKHGVKLWCFLACKKKDAAEEKIKNGKTRFKYKFIERFVYPFSAKYGVILTCITSGDVTGGGCAEKLKEQGIDRNGIPAEEVAEILEDLENAEKRGNLRLGSVIMERLLTKLIGKTAARTTLSAIPVAGQIYLGLTILYFVDQFDQAIDNNELSKIAADINSSQYLEYYTAMRSDSDGLKKGVLPLEDAGILVDELDGAEKSRVWAAYNGKEINRNDDDYKCANGKPIPDNELVCEEKKVARQYKIEEVRDNFFVNGVIDLLNPMDNCLHLSPDLDLGGLGIDVSIDTPCAYKVRDVVGGLLGAVNWATETVFGPVAKGLVAALKALPVTKDLVSLMEEKFSELTMAVFGKIWPLPVAVDSQPREKYDALEAGGALAGSEFAQGGYTDKGSYGQGAPKVSKEVFGAVYQDYMDQREYEFKTSGFVNRVANTDEPNSLISKMASSVPTGFSNMLFSIISSPMTLFKSLANLPNTIFGSSASAQTLAQRQAEYNPFGVSLHAWPLNHPALTADPGMYTADYCKKSEEARLASSKENKTTGFEEFDKADPCLLERSTVDAGCTMFVEGSGCLEEDSTIVEGDAPIVTGTAKELAQKLVGYMNEGKYKCDNREDCNDIKLMARGESISCAVHDCPAYDACHVNHLDKKVMQLLIYLIDNGYEIGTYALCRSHSDSGGVHDDGLAADISSINGKSLCDSCGSVAKSITLEVDELIFNLKGSLAPQQIITWGVGGSHYPEFNKYNRSAPGVTGGGAFDSGTLNGHMNHIHVGY